MRILAVDPFVSSQTAKDLGVELVPLDEVFAQSDYLSLHVGLTPETRGIVNAASIAKMKPHVRIINCARGELIDAAALAGALHSGAVAGAGLDVFDPEPLPADSPLLSAPNLIATPHIAGSTEEAQEIVGLRIVDQLIEYLRNGVAINGVNMPAISAEQYRSVAPFVTLAERLGAFAAQIATGNPRSLRLTYTGRVAEMNTSLVRNAALAGALNHWLTTRANVVNAMQIAAQRNLNVAEAHDVRAVHTDTLRVELETEAGVTSVSGADVLGRPRLLQVDGISCEVALSGRLLYLRNLDVPGVIGHVGTVLGRNQINIANFSLGREDKQAGPEPVGAVAVVEVDSPVPDSVLAELRQNPAVRIARVVEPGA
jgi:D-3-phosphoglycerate dehydrogenase